ncbi:MAG: DegT/DnrJ/EryC1/StrS family aminotransferase [bacterium]|nr:DegT/DnrJ/EryC1/StrS family aminotransferase [bacterium]
MKKTMIHMFFKVLRLFNKRFFVPFVCAHFYLTKVQHNRLKQLCGIENKELESELNAHLQSTLQMDGPPVLFASARMAFYAGLLAYGIGPGDEVILTGFTCAVMCNAVLRTGATPVYADVNGGTFGTDATAVLGCVSARTKLIVVQHSFGIPADADAIFKAAEQRQIPVLEDCAISVGSTRQNQMVGTIGDMAIFSFDHSKPLNGLVGGAIFVKDKARFQRVCEIQAQSPSLPMAMQTRQIKQVWHERRLYHPGLYGPLLAFNLIKSVLLKSKPLFLSEDGDGATPTTQNEFYSYPSKMPAYAMQLVLWELQRWPETQLIRKRFLTELLSLFDRHQLGGLIQEAYRSPDIVPLRLAFCVHDGGNLKRRLGRFIDMGWNWFERPIIAGNKDLSVFAYVPGSCPVAEAIGHTIVNIPCHVHKRFQKSLLKTLDWVLCHYANDVRSDTDLR